MALLRADSAVLLVHHVCSDAKYSIDRVRVHQGSSSSFCGPQQC